MKRKIAVFALLIAAVSAKAQNSRYKIVENDPDKARTTTLDLQIFDLGWYQGIGMSLGGRAHTFLTPKVEPFLAYKKAYVNDPAISDGAYDGTIVSKGGIKSGIAAEAGCSYYFFSRKVASTTKMNLNAVASRDLILQYYSEVPTIVKHMVGARGGITYNRRTMDLYDQTHPYYFYKSSDGKYTVPIDDFDPKVSHLQPAGFAANPYTNMHVVAIFAGICYKNIKHTKIDVEDVGRRQKAKNLDLYADVMFAPIMGIANVIDTQKREWLIVPHTNTMHRFGYRVGLSKHSGKTVGTTYTLEAGKKPAAAIGQGFFNTGGFINITYGMCISTAWKLLKQPKTPPPLPVDIKDNSAPKI